VKSPTIVTIQARDVYLAQIAHALWLDISRSVYWQLDGWSDNELSYLLSSKVMFKVTRGYSSDKLYYCTGIAGAGDTATENLLGDPRI
jgi:hypothetical protein